MKNTAEISFGDVCFFSERLKILKCTFKSQTVPGVAVFDCFIGHFQCGFKGIFNRLPGKHTGEKNTREGVAGSSGDVLVFSRKSILHLAVL